MADDVTGDLSAVEVAALMGTAVSTANEALTAYRVDYVEEPVPNPARVTDEGYTRRVYDREQVDAMVRDLKVAKNGVPGYSTMQDVAARTGWSYTLVNGLCTRGVLTSYKVGRSRFVSDESVEYERLRREDMAAERQAAREAAEAKKQRRAAELDRKRQAAREAAEAARVEENRRVDALKEVAKVIEDDMKAERARAREQARARARERYASRPRGKGGYGEPKPGDCVYGGCTREGKVKTPYGSFCSAHAPQLK